MSTPRLNVNTALFKYLAASSAPPIDVLTTTPTIVVRTACTSDLQDLSDILTYSFHEPDGAMKWVLPLMRMGIYEDLRHRLRNSVAPYACLVAIRRTGEEPEVDLTIDPAVGSERAFLQTGSAPSTPPASSTLASIQGERVGTVEIAVRQWGLWRSPTKYVYLSNLAVQASHRRQGAAIQLLKGCEIMARRWGFQDIYLHVLENNETARNLYGKLGYQIYQTETDLVSWLFRRPRQLLLHKRLSA